MFMEMNMDVETAKKIVRRTRIMAGGLLASFVGLGLLGAFDHLQDELAACLNKEGLVRCISAYNEAKREKREAEKAEAEAAQKVSEEAERMKQCQFNWKVCKDLREYHAEGRRSDGAYQCSRAARDVARFEVELPWFAFDELLNDPDEFKKGVIIRRETGAKYQNGFGAFHKVEVECSFDLNSEKVIDLKTFPR